MAHVTKALGRKVAVLFDDDGEEVWCIGRVAEVEELVDVEGEKWLRHLIAFDDGDRCWYSNLAEMEAHAVFRWVVD